MSLSLWSLINKETPSPYKLVLLKRGDILFHENERCETIGIILSGEISIVSYSYQGNEIIYNKLEENEVFGNNLIFSSNPYYRGNIIAKKASKVALINKKALISLLKHNEEFLVCYLNIQSDFGKHLNAVLKLLSFQNAKDRFFYYLYLKGETFTFKNVNSLAHTLFLSRETLSRLLTKLVKEKRIQRVKNRISLVR